MCVCKFIYIFHFLLLHSLLCGCFALRLLSNIKGECQRGVSSCSAKVSDDCPTPNPNPSPSSSETHQTESKPLREKNTDRERESHASVSKHIIMYFFKTQKATPQHTDVESREGARVMGATRGQLVNKSKAKQSVKFMLHERPKQLSSRWIRERTDRSYANFVLFCLPTKAQFGICSLSLSYSLFTYTHLEISLCDQLR